MASAASLTLSLSRLCILVFNYFYCYCLLLLLLFLLLLLYLHYIIATTFTTTTTTFTTTLLLLLPTTTFFLSFFTNHINACAVTAAATAATTRIIVIMDVPAACVEYLYISGVIGLFIERTNVRCWLSVNQDILYSLRLVQRPTSATLYSRREQADHPVAEQSICEYAYRYPAQRLFDYLYRSCGKFANKRNEIIRTMSPGRGLNSRPSVSCRLTW